MRCVAESTARCLEGWTLGPARRAVGASLSARTRLESGRTSAHVKCDSSTACSPTPLLDALTSREKSRERLPELDVVLPPPLAARSDNALVDAAASASVAAPHREERRGIQTILFFQNRRKKRVSMILSRGRGKAGRGRGRGGGGGGAAAGDALGARSGARKSMGELRIMKDLEELDIGSIADVTADPSDMLQISVTVKPDEGFWLGGRFSFTVVIPRDYPHSPPKVKCVTEVRVPPLSPPVPSRRARLERVPGGASARSPPRSLFSHLNARERRTAHTLLSLSRALAAFPPEYRLRRKRVPQYSQGRMEARARPYCGRRRPRHPLHGAKHGRPA